MHTTTLRVALVTAALLASAPGALAQQPEAVAVRVVSVKATVLDEDAEQPKIPEALSPWAELLSKIPGFETTKKRFDFVSLTTRPATPGATQEYPLPCDLQATVSAKLRPDGKLDVRLELTRPGKPPKKPEERQRLVLEEFTAADGATHVVKVQDAFKKGDHLVLLVTPGTKLEDD